MQRDRQATKTLGILGGMGPASTVDFYRRIIEATDAATDQDHLHILIESNPFVPDRTAFLQGRGADPTPTLIHMAHNLEQAGADMLVIACNTANIFHDQIAKAIDIPLIHWSNTVAEGISALENKPTSIGLLASTGAIMSGLYQEACMPYGIQILLPDDALQKELMFIIYSIVKNGLYDPELVTHVLDTSMHYFKNLEAEAILCACTELSLILSTYPIHASLPIFDASQIVADQMVISLGASLKRKNKERKPPHIRLGSS